MRSSRLSPAYAALALLLGLSMAFVLPAEAPAQQAVRTIVIGTGPVAGTYFPAGGALCAMVNRGTARHGLRCLVQPTDGSRDNLDRLERGEIDFALVQSDWQYLAARGGYREDGKPFADLRAVMSLQAQPISLVVHPESQIASVEDLKGRRVGLGPPGSGTRAAAETLIGAYGFMPDDFESIYDSGLAGQGAALCTGLIDAFIAPVNHPNGVLAAVAATCGARLVDVDGPQVDRLIADWPFYSEATIPAGLYAANSEPVRSFGVRTTLVTTSGRPADVVYEVVKAAIENLDDLKRQHGALTGLRREDMATLGMSADLHEGALRYFQEVGLR
jgi:uncharacterized protein